MAQQIERRIGEAFLLMNIRQAERVTAEEVRLTQMELEQQLGGLFSLLTVEFLVPYLNRTLLILQRSQQIPKIPKGLVSPTIVAGVNALGRGQDQQSLTTFITTLAQTVGPESLMQHVNVSEYIKRLAASQGIDVLNLIKTEEELQQEAEEQQQAQAMQSLSGQVGSLASSPLMDPSKNPSLGAPEEGEEVPEEGEAPPEELPPEE